MIPTPAVIQDLDSPHNQNWRGSMLIQVLKYRQFSGSVEPWMKTWDDGRNACSRFSHLGTWVLTRDNQNGGLVSFNPSAGATWSRADQDDGWWASFARRTHSPLRRFSA